MELNNLKEGIHPRPKGQGFLPAKVIKDDVLNGIPFKQEKRTTGEILKLELGLKDFKSVWIRKIIDLALNVYIVYFNSHYPSSYLSMQKIKNLDTFTIERLKKSGISFNRKSYRYTPPIPLEDFNGTINSNSMLIRIDITGEFFANKKLYVESFNKEYFKENRIIIL